MPVTTGSVTTKPATTSSGIGNALGGGGGGGTSTASAAASAAGAKSSTTMAAASAASKSPAASATSALSKSISDKLSVASKTPTAATNTYSGPKGTNLGLNQAAKEASTRAAGYQPVTVSASPKATDTMARLMIAESRSLKNESGKVNVKGLQAVGEVIKNRVLSDKKFFPDTILGVINQRKQFSPVRDGSLAKITSKDRDYKVSLAVAKSVLDGTAPPIAGNALNYGNIHTIMNKPGYSSAATKKAFAGMTPTLQIADAKNPISRSHTFGTIGKSDVVQPRFAGYERPSYPAATTTKLASAASVLGRSPSTPVAPRQQYQPTTAALTPKIMDRLAPERDVPSYTQYQPTKPAEERNQYQPQMSSGEYLNQRVNQNVFTRVASNDPNFVVEKPPGMVGKMQDRIPATGPDSATQVDQMISTQGNIQDKMARAGIAIPHYVNESILDKSIGGALRSLGKDIPWTIPSSIMKNSVRDTMVKEGMKIPQASMTQASYDPNGPVLPGMAPGGMATDTVDPLADLSSGVGTQAPSQQGTMASPSQGPGKPVAGITHKIENNPVVRGMNNIFGKNGTGAIVPSYESRGNRPWEEFIPLLGAMAPLYNSNDDFLNYLFGDRSYG